MDPNILSLYAANFAAHAHRNQRRRYHGLPYINHLLRVGEQAALAGLSSEAIAAAFLHDIIEDTDTKESDLVRYFSPRVVALVKMLTKWWPDGANDPEVASHKQKYYLSISGDKEATCLKLLDRADNVFDFTTSLPDAKDEATRYLSETKLEFPILLDCCKNKLVISKFNDSLGALSTALGQKF